MPTGFAFALSEVSLVAFTTLAPSGAVAFALMAIPLYRSGLDAAVRERLSKLLCIPLVATMIGLIASATHLGNPDNALYVLAGVGRSPLSTEVVCAVAFLALAGVYWLLTFARRFPLGIQRVWLALATASAAVFVTAVALAYRQETIVTWNLWQIPVALWLNALVGGPLLTLLGLRAARVPLGATAARALLGVSAVALIADVAVYVAQLTALAGIRNAVGPALGLAPQFGFAIVAFAVLGAAGIAVSVAAEWAAGAPVRSTTPEGAPTLVSSRPASPEGVPTSANPEGMPAPASASAPERDSGSSPASGRTPLTGVGTPAYRRQLLLSCLSCLMAFAGIFLMRFVFYMTHMTVGLSV